MELSSYDLKLEGRKISLLSWLTPNGEENKRPENGETIVYHEQLFGDYTVPWALVIDREGTEIMRHNLRGITSLHWLDETPKV
jgi:hypothetical protein